MPSLSLRMSDIQGSEMRVGAILRLLSLEESSPPSFSRLIDADAEEVTPALVAAGTVGGIAGVAETYPGV